MSERQQGEELEIENWFTDQTPPVPQEGEQQGNPRLRDRIRQQILASDRHRIPFAAWMDLALYDPQEGYYTTNATHIGATGDFVTSPHLGADFGELLAVQFVDLWEQLDYPTPFTLVEMGAGQGLIVQDVLRYLHRHHFDCFSALEYLIVEKSPALIAMQQRRLQKLADSWGHLHWCTWDDIPSNSIVGCCFSNELVDALPVHGVQWQQGTLREVYVTLTGEAFSEVLDDLSTPKLLDYFQLNGVGFPSAAYPDGYRTEINLAALEWMATVADRLQRGIVLTIDYGYPAQRYYHPARTGGTLQCYYQHAHHSDPYLYLGQQDITAHVDFTALEQQGKRCGLEPLGLTQQGLFLMALGLGDRIAALSHSEATSGAEIQAVLRRREALHALINPIGMGNFYVLLQGKGWDRETPLRGLTMPAEY